MALIKTASGSTGFASDKSSCVWGHSASSLGTQLVVGAVASNEGGQSMTFNSTAMTLIGYTTYGGSQVSLWYHYTNTTAAVTCAANFPTGYAVAGTISYNGVASTSASSITFRASSVAAGGSTKALITVPSSANDIIMDVTGWVGSGGSFGITPDALQSLLRSNGPNGWFVGGISEKTATSGAASSMSWSDGSHNWSYAAVSIRGTSGTTAASVPSSTPNTITLSTWASTNVTSTLAAKAVNVVEDDFVFVLALANSTNIQLSLSDGALTTLSSAVLDYTSVVWGEFAYYVSTFTGSLTVNSTGGSKNRVLDIAVFSNVSTSAPVLDYKLSTQNSSVPNQQTTANPSGALISGIIHAASSNITGGNVNPDSSFVGILGPTTAAGSTQPVGWGAVAWDNIAGASTAGSTWSISVGSTHRSYSILMALNPTSSPLGGTSTQFRIFLMG